MQLKSENETAKREINRLMQDLENARKRGRGGGNNL